MCSSPFTWQAVREVIEACRNQDAGLAITGDIAGGLGTASTAVVGVAVAVRSEMTSGFELCSAMKRFARRRRCGNCSVGFSICKIVKE